MHVEIMTSGVMIVVHSLLIRPLLLQQSNLTDTYGTAMAVTLTVGNSGQSSVWAVNDITIFINT